MRMRTSGAITASLQIAHWPIILVGSVGMLLYALALVADIISLIKGGNPDNVTD
jgi:hypothetical protein